MKRLLVLMLLLTFIARSMEKSNVAPVQSVGIYQPRSLVAYCIAQLEKDIRGRVFPQQCSLLAQAIAAKISLSQSMNIDSVMEKLIAITQLSQENELIRITPVSLEFKKKIPADIIGEFTSKFVEERTEEILPSLYRNCAIFTMCVDRVMNEFYHSKYLWEKHIQSSTAHPILISFLERTKIGLEQEESSRRYYEERRRWANESPGFWWNSCASQDANGNWSYTTE